MGCVKEKVRKSAAILTIYDADKMTPKGIKDVAEWLRGQADELEREGNSYAPLVRSRFQYRK